MFADLLREADIVVENFSAGTLERLGIGYAFARSINPRVIYCSISGFGATQATGTGKAMDSIIQALSGLMMTSGAAGEPPVRVGVPVADLIAPVFGVVGILAALRQREATGTGQYVDVSMLGVLTSLVAAEPFDLLEACGLPQRTGRDGAAADAVRRFTSRRTATSRSARQPSSSPAVSSPPSGTPSSKTTRASRRAMRVWHTWTR